MSHDANLDEALRRALPEWFVEALKRRRAVTRRQALEYLAHLQSHPETAEGPQDLERIAAVLTAGGDEVQEDEFETERSMGVLPRDDLARQDLSDAPGARPMPGSRTPAEDEPKEPPREGEKQP